ncbi:hypothetical protein EV356DRAFT_543014 [Viridothelium virens]|uniref:C2H2-type domain-containing protein n=1 Tax=Viridothelium virens TaxID=1048519 RepID=A0A6A6GS76_VIRVR|nr:hypothetical protein EV356DRAFT_543014 [Viridothelium virens]
MFNALWRWYCLVAGLWRRTLSNCLQNYARVAGNNKSAKRHQLSHHNLKGHLSKLILTIQQEGYFKVSLKQPKQAPGKAGIFTSNQLAADLAQFMRYLRTTWERDPKAALSDEVASERYTEVYIGLLIPPVWEKEQHEAASAQESALVSDRLAAHDSTPAPPKTDVHELPGQTQQHGMEEAAVTGKPRCPFCQRTLFIRSGLMRHYHLKHVKEGLFISPFKCPECCRVDMEDAWIKARKSGYSSHVKRVHGKLHAPLLPSHPPRNGLTQHFRETYVEKKNLFDKPFPCPECGRSRDGDGDGDGDGDDNDDNNDGEKEEGRTRNERALIHDEVDVWIGHIRVFHGKSAIQALPVHPLDTSELKRKHAYNDPGEAIINLTSTTDDCRKRIRTCCPKDDFDSYSGTEDCYYLDVTGLDASQGCGDPTYANGL